MPRTLFFTAFVLAALAAGAQDFGFGEPEAETDAGTQTPAVPGLTFGGEVDFSGRAFVDAADPASSAVQTPSSAVVRLGAGGAAVDLTLALRVSPEILASNPGRVIDEAVLRTYLGNLELTTGLAKIAWGKGDSLRVLDLINPQDYTDFINQDLEDRKVAQALFKADLRTGESGKWEAVYVPFFEGDTLPLEGTWAPKAFTDLRRQIRTGFYSGSNPSANGGIGDGVYAAAYSVTLGGLVESAIVSALAAGAPDYATAAASVTGNSTTMATLRAQASQMAAAQAESQVDAMIDDLLVFPNTKTLSWGQGGLRYTDSFAGFDWGLQYYTGFLRTPVFNADPAKLAATRHLAVSYNRYHQAGADAAFVLFDVNLRAEAAWHQTADVPGTDPLVRNPFASAALGLDRTLAGISLNLQGLATWTPGLSGARGAFDVEKDADEYSGTVAGQAAYRFWNDRAEVSLAASTSLPDRDWVLIPGLEVTPVDDVTLSVGGKWFGGDAQGQLGQYADRSFFEVKAGYTF